MVATASVLCVQQRVGGAIVTHISSTDRLSDPGFGFWLFFYSFIYINSSSSRAALFLWTSHFCSMLARVYVAAKYVWRAAQNAGLADNNFGHGTFCVDNYPVVPELSPELSTIFCSWAETRRKKARSPSKNSGPGGVKHRVRVLVAWRVARFTGPVLVLPVCLRHHRVCRGGGHGDLHHRLHPASCRPCGDHRGGPWHQTSFAARASGRRRRSW